MKLYEALKRLEDKSEILININNGSTFQRLNDDSIMETFAKDSILYKNGNIAKSMSNDDFTYICKDANFQILSQWFHKDIEFPILCRVRELHWADDKIVCFRYRSENTFHTGFGESYTPLYNTKIIPLTDEALDFLKQGYRVDTSRIDGVNNGIF